MVSWDAPQGFEFGDIQWPVPEKLPFGPLTNYGYEGNPVLLQDLKLPNALAEGPVTLTTNVDLLVCEEICIPESHTASLTLNGVQAGQPLSIASAQAKLPLAVGWEAQFEEDGDVLSVEISTDQITAFSQTESIVLFPEDWGLVDNTQDSQAVIEGNKLVITQKRGERDVSDIPVTKMVVAYEDPQGKQKSVRFSALMKDNQNLFMIGHGGTEPNLTILGAIIFAILGGLILNLMPCVFPVLSMKALSLCKLKGEEEKTARLHGLAYTAGILVSFGVIAGLLLILKSTGAQIGWGFQLQNPVIIIALAYMLFLIGLNLFGFFEITGNFVNFGSSLTQKSGISGSFFTGILATLVATPCTAPFMGAAMGFALVQPAAISMLIFLSLGLGLALPYLALSFIPALRHLLPKPGAWMETFKQFLAFPMFASAIWLVWVLSQQAGPSGVLQVLLGILFIAFAIWIFKYKNLFAKSLGVLGLVTALSPLFMAMPVPQDQTNLSGNAIEFTPDNLESALSTNDPVFVNMTAAWCITCKVNERVALNIESTQSLFKNLNIQYLKGDWTNQDPDITEYLNSFGRSGVPIYVYYKSPNADGIRPAPVVLPQILTPGIVEEILTQ